MRTGLLSGSFPRWALTPSESGSTFPSEAVQYAEAGTLTHERTHPPEAPEPRCGSPGAPPQPRARAHLQHELTLISPHEDELSREPVTSAAAAHQEPGGGAHLGTGEACPALGGEGSSEQGSPAWARAPGHPKDRHRSCPDEVRAPSRHHRGGRFQQCWAPGQPLTECARPLWTLPRLRSPGPPLHSRSTHSLFSLSGCQRLGAWGASHTACV